MGLNFRKSIKIAPGIRVNISKKGLSSVSVGGKGARVNVSKKGTRTTVGIPGTGLSYTTNTSYKKSKGTLNDPIHLIQQEDLGKEKRNILVSILLWIGILWAPYIFAWFTLQRKYSNTERFIAFGWLIIVVIAMLIK
ncbi:hypothetical protein APD31_10500 [Acinetobacter baumannii]|nr:DUF4236 domain-containing protein [Acinetobacter baumannii]EHU1917894.1 DUF4236 domain-containing protein [Acinetobacter baumannii]EKW7786328.1 DUF4236 domain-containing protein [Acinetobacter baumannii]KQD91970.1 hypothetical protein APD31_10500 [Acinetobacter baumannii]KQD97562.1 hypothetical protein APD32_13285 [Acinetobacter baumannii]MBF6794369.1 DUF4236 domain-containing protein [Acinetobacter baumannii]